MFAETLKRLDELGTRVAGLDGQRLEPVVRGAARHRLELRPAGPASG